jgi:hypothetical protein
VRVIVFLFSQKRGFDAIADISGIGVRQYYELYAGYRLEGTYMVRDLTDDDLRLEHEFAPATRIPVDFQPEPIAQVEPEPREPERKVVAKQEGRSLRTLIAFLIGFVSFVMFQLFIRQ